MVPRNTAPEDFVVLASKNMDFWMSCASALLLPVGVPKEQQIPLWQRVRKGLPHEVVSKVDNESTNRRVRQRPMAHVPSLPAHDIFVLEAFFTPVRDQPQQLPDHLSHTNPKKVLLRHAEVQETCSHVVLPSYHLFSSFLLASRLPSSNAPCALQRLPLTSLMLLRLSFAFLLPCLSSSLLSSIPPAACTRFSPCARRVRPEGLHRDFGQMFVPSAGVELVQTGFRLSEKNSLVENWLQDGSAKLQPGFNPGLLGGCGIQNFSSARTIGQSLSTKREDADHLVTGLSCPRGV